MEASGTGARPVPPVLACRRPCRLSPALRILQLSKVVLRMSE